MNSKKSLLVRVKHDSENPYIIINKKSIRDPNLSLEAVGLLARLLCNRDDWVIHVTQLMEANRCGKDKIYRILKELVNNGYAYLHVERDKGKFKSSTWYVFETPKFEEDIKKMFPNPENPDTVKPDAANPPLMINNPIINNEKEKEKEKKEEAAPPGISSFFYEKLKSINPKLRNPNLKAWEAEFFRLMKDGNGNSEEEIKSVIEYIISTKDKPSSNGFSWANVILSPQSLRKNYAKVWAEMNSSISEKKSGSISENYAIIKKLFEKYQSKMDFVFSEEYIEFLNGPTSNHIRVDDKNFKEKVIMEIKKRKLTLP